MSAYGNDRRGDDETVVPFKRKPGRPRKHSRDLPIAGVSCTLFLREHDDGRGSPEDHEQIEKLRRNDELTKLSFFSSTPSDFKEGEANEIKVTEVNLIPGINGAPILLEVRTTSAKKPRGFAYIGRGGILSSRYPDTD